MTPVLEGVSRQQHALAALYHRERHGIHFIGGWVGPRASLDGRKILSPPGFFLKLVVFIHDFGTGVHIGRYT